MDEIILSSIAWTSIVWSYIVTLYLMKIKNPFDENDKMQIISLIPIANVIVITIMIWTDSEVSYFNINPKLKELIYTLVKDGTLEVSENKLSNHQVGIRIVSTESFGWVCYFDGKSYNLDNKTIKLLKKYIDSKSNIDVKLEIYKTRGCRCSN